MIEQSSPTTWENRQVSILRGQFNSFEATVEQQGRAGQRVLEKPASGSIMSPEFRVERGTPPHQWQ
jgi:hypothetical protein